MGGTHISLPGELLMGGEDGGECATLEKEVSESSKTLLSTSLICTIFALGNPRQKGHSVMHPIDRDLSSPSQAQPTPQALVPRTHGAFQAPSTSPQHSVVAHPGATPTEITSTHGCERT